MKTTPFIDVHIALSVKIYEFAGLNTPIEYSRIIDEHTTVVNGVGVFDVSRMGEFWVKGLNALAFIQGIASNGTSVLPLGEAQYTCFPNDKGGVVGNLLVCHYEPEKYLLVANAGNIDKGWERYVSHNTVDAELESSSNRTVQLVIRGPRAQGVLQHLALVDLSSTPYYSSVAGEFAGYKDVTVSNTRYTGTGSFELYFYPNGAMTIWNIVFKAGKPERTKPIGSGIRDTLRLEMGFCLYGGDLDDTTSPIKAGSGWITKFTGGKNFTNRVELEHQKKEGVTRKLCAFRLQEKGIPRHDYEVVDVEGNIVGVVISDTVSPALKKGIGMGYVEPEFAKAGTDIFIKVRSKNLRIQVVKVPFRK